MMFETGLNKTQFKKVLKFLKIEEMTVRVVKNSLSVYLSQFRHGYLDELTVR